MCGIAGLVGIQTDPSVHLNMLRTMKRRGPDASGVYVHQDVVLLHGRLAIIDPEGGQQPMELLWNSKKYVMVYNGELYNTSEIRQELEAYGHVFLGHSDTEVVLHAFAQWQEDCLERLNGIFAFAVYEPGKKRVFLARDRIGVKPLFYTQVRDGLVFASEIKTILACPGVKAELDPEGAAQVMLLGPGRIPGSGVFHGIRELEPGCCGCYSSGTLSCRRYWKLRDREHQETFDETVECVRYLVEDAIRRQMVSDVPIGTFLSGGLDSSLITAICARQMGNEGKRLHTFSVDYKNNDQYFQPGKFQPNSDNAYIRRMERYVDCIHHWTVLQPEELIEALYHSTVARDLPGMADVDGSLLAFCQQIRREVKVALSGECADEIFGGYPWYRDPEVRAIDGFPWAQNTGHRVELAAQGLLSKMEPAEFVHDLYCDTCRDSDILPGNQPQERRMKEMVNLNFRWFMQTLLDRKDRMSMYAGLEVRVPFCDYRIAEYLYGVPWEMKDHGGTEKGLLRKAMEGYLPDEILWRKKSPYPKTFDPKYRELVSARLQQLLDDPAEKIWYLVNRETAKNLLTAESVWPWYGQLMRGPQTMAYLLQVDFWLQHYQIDFLF